MQGWDNVGKKMYCLCGCGQETSGPLVDWRPGHSARVYSCFLNSEVQAEMAKKRVGLTRTPEQCENMSDAQILSYEEDPSLSESRYGEGNSNWKGGISLRVDPRSSLALRESIRMRDNYTCQGCGKTPEACVHHIDEDPLNEDEHNLITVCKSCNARASLEDERDYWFGFYTDRIRDIYSKSSSLVSGEAR